MVLSHKEKVIARKKEILRQEAVNESKDEIEINVKNEENIGLISSEEKKVKTIFLMIAICITLMAIIYYVHGMLNTGTDLKNIPIKAIPSEVIVKVPTPSKVSNGALFGQVENSINEVLETMLTILNVIGVLAMVSGLYKLYAYGKDGSEGECVDAIKVIIGSVFIILTPSVLRFAMGMM